MEDDKADGSGKPSGKYILTKEDSAKGGRNVTHAQIEANKVNALKHGRRAKSDIVKKIRLCSECQFREHCHAVDLKVNRCSLDIARFKNFLKIGISFSARSFAISYVELLTSMIEDMFRMTDQILELEIAIPGTKESYEEEREELKQMKKDKVEEKLIWRQKNVVSRFGKIYFSLSDQKERLTTKITILKSECMKRVKEGKTMVIGDKVTIEQKQQIDVMFHEFDQTLKMMVDKYEAEGNTITIESTETPKD